MFDVNEVRSRFPALERSENGRPVAYLDGPGGTQVPKSVIDSMAGVLTNGISNGGGGFGASEFADQIADGARRAGGRFFNADPGEIVFGQNMTSLTFSVSRSIADTWKPGDAIVLTSLDHDANFTPWVMEAEDRGVHVRVAEFDTDDFILDPTAVIDLLDESVVHVAVGLSSNALGSVTDVATISRAAHEIGATVFVDGVHAGPHHRIDVQELGCDFLVASAYKFFGPHTGLMFGRLEHLASLVPYKVRPAPSDPPGKWETGTQSYESMAGVTAAIEHVESLGDGTIESAFDATEQHEVTLGQRLLDGIDAMGHVRLYGVPVMDDRRVATFALSVEGHHPSDVAAAMAARGVYVWAGHYYAVNVMQRLGLEDSGGLVRIGLVHYNTGEEVDRALEVLESLS